MEGERQVWNVVVPLVRAVAAITDSVVHSATRNRLHRVGAEEFAPGAGIRGRLIAAVLFAITVVVVDLVKGDLHSAGEAPEWLGAIVL